MPTNCYPSCVSGFTAEPKPNEASDERASPPLLNPPVNILLVDDDARNLEVLESLLGAPDYNLVRALTGEQALRWLLETEFAVIVLDVRMPDVTGIELANLIKQRRRTQHIPIIFLTAYFQEDAEVLQGYDTGAVDYLTKPINPQILKSKIGVFVDLFRKTRALAASNEALSLEIHERQKAEEALRQANNQLEERVQARTADLIRVNDELRLREAALRASEAQAKAASRTKDDFLAALSHELRTPLNPVLLLATEAAGDPRWPAEVRGVFETIAKNVALEARLIDDLLDLTRIARGKLTLDLRPTDVHLSLQEALSMAREDFEQKQIAVTVELRAERHTVLGDDVRLKQVFWNVLKNAAKFTPPAGRATIETEVLQEANEILVKVTDTGLGMTPAELERLFEAFAQGDHANQGGFHQFGGLGLGLAISRRMVEIHLGSISAASGGRHQGTSILIKLPLVPATATGPAASIPLPPPRALRSKAPAGTSRYRVLVVEDHRPTALALEQLLTRRNYSVVVARGVGEARTAASREDFDILISDIGLPDGNGHDLMTELRGRSGLIGIALTGYGTDEDLVRSRAAGFVAQLTKPVTMQDLESVLAAAGKSLNK